VKKSKETHQNSPSPTAPSHAQPNPTEAIIYVDAVTGRFPLPIALPETARPDEASATINQFPERPSEGTIERAIAGQRCEQVIQLQSTSWALNATRTLTGLEDVHGISQFRFWQSFPSGASATKFIQDHCFNINKTCVEKKSSGNSKSYGCDDENVIGKCV
jgi:hypothetical protein